jgi:hypothetical protein
VTTFLRRALDRLGSNRSWSSGNAWTSTGFWFDFVLSVLAQLRRRGTATLTQATSDESDLGAHPTRKLVTGAGVVAVSLAATLAVAAPASADTPRNEGAACIQAGLDTLKSLGLLQDAAQKKIDYSTLADPTTGPIFTTLPEGSFLSLGQVVKLHKTNPELFAWCR